MKQRSNLYVPSNRLNFVEGIGGLNADIFTLDLEDSVPEQEKPRGREIVNNRLVHLGTDRPVYVRVNNLGTGMTYDDLTYSIPERSQEIAGICYPKCEDADEIRKIDSMLDFFEEMVCVKHGTIKLQILIETPKAMVNANEIARASKRAEALIFGVVDFTADMHIKLNQPVGIEYTWARQMVACVAVANELEPIDCPYANIKDIIGFSTDCEYSKGIGYRGRIVVHPSQIEVANKLYSPSADELELANEIVGVFESEMAKGKGSVMYKGNMIAKAVYKNAKNVLAYGESK